jgi:hypothetical protein
MDNKLLGFFKNNLLGCLTVFPMLSRRRVRTGDSCPQNTTVKNIKFYSIQFLSESKGISSDSI